MAKKTCKGLTYAKYVSGGDGSAIVYQGGKVKADYLCKVDIREDRADDKEYADGHRIDSDNRLNGSGLDLELANNDADIKKDVLGYLAGTADGELDVSEDDAPFVGVGFILCNRFKGVETYEGYWVYKIQFSTGGVTSNTRRESEQWEHETVNGESVSVKLTAAGDAIYYSQILNQATEAAVRTWLNGKANVPST